MDWLKNIFFLKKGTKSFSPQSGLKKCPSCNTFQNATKEICPICGFDLRSIEYWREDKKKNMATNLPRRIALIICLLFFIAFAISASISWYELGSGLSYRKEYKIAKIIEKQSKFGMHQSSPMGKTLHEKIVDISTRDGIIFSGLMTAGISLSILFYSLIAVVIPGFDSGRQAIWR